MRAFGCSRNSSVSLIGCRWSVQFGGSSNATFSMMATLIDNYEQQYAVLTADITGKIGRLSRSHGGDRKHLSTEVDRHLEEAQELLEQMELEIREVEVSQRAHLRTRVDSYQAELRRLNQEFKNAKSVNYYDGVGDQVEGDILNDGLSIREEQRQRLLNNSELLENTGNMLTAGYRATIEAEEIGARVLQDLNNQRETIQRARSRLRETDAELGRSSRVLSSMVLQSMQHRFIVIGVVIAVTLVLLWAIYYIISKS